MSEAGGCLLLVLIGLGMGLVYAALSAIPVFFLWNLLIPGIFGLPYIDFWQAFGLCWLCSLLFKSGSSSSSSKSDK